MDKDDWKEWIGRVEVTEEVISAFPTAALMALLDRDPARPLAGDPIPALSHWLNVLPLHRHSELGPDGHEKRGSFMPPIALPRRMFAGARVEFRHPIRVGDVARRESTVRSVTRKSGRSGDLVFVAVRQEIYAGGLLALVEDQDIVYRDPDRGKAAPDETAPEALPEATFSRSFVPDNAALFRYSALLYNAHRIHYDHDFAVGHENYRGLIVHGQLVATLLADLATRARGRMPASFRFRSQRPFFANEPITLSGQDNGSSIDLFAIDAEGRIGMRASAEFAM